MSSHKNGMTYSCDHAAVVTKSDTAKLPRTSRFLFIGGAGNLRVTTAAGDTLTINSIANSTVLPLEVTQVHSLSTTATSLVAMW
jgi:hypothetical protein